ncbi:hypothetical protein J3R83DRAFT_10446 [Lanmaoa asiatica]|nr:hypothetical protein J3R83DRAFT_10446 [Lanmaoa asiatica]
MDLPVDNEPELPNYGHKMHAPCVKNHTPPRDQHACTLSEPQQDRGTPELGNPEDPEDQVKQAKGVRKPTIPDFQEDLPPPSIISERPFLYAMKKIETFEYVELWYFSKDGMKEASKQSHSQADDAFGLLSTSNILTLRPVASVKASKNALADHELPLATILKACITYLEQIEKIGWPKKHIMALCQFFYAIEGHPYRKTMKRGECIMALYAAKVCRLWHDKLKVKNRKAFNIGLINHKLLQNVVIEVNDQIVDQVSTNSGTAFMGVSYCIQPTARSKLRCLHKRPQRQTINVPAVPTLPVQSLTIRKGLLPYAAGLAFYHASLTKKQAKRELCMPIMPQMSLP